MTGKTSGERTLDIGAMCKDAQSARKYSHSYECYMDILKLLATATRPYKCHSVPACWVPFVLYMNHKVDGTWVNPPSENHPFDLINWEEVYDAAEDKRRVVEVASACRPELVDALFKHDTEWPVGMMDSMVTTEKQFPVTCNGSFFRKEIRDYNINLRRFEPKKPYAVLVPCAADKPYPAPLHREVMERLPEENKDKWDVIVVTGVLGLIPSSLWNVAPHYDSGLPNRVRVEDTVQWFFKKWRREFKALVVYSDFYANAIAKGLIGLSIPTAFVNGVTPRVSYENLLLSENLDRLEITMLDAARGDIPEPRD